MHIKLYNCIGKSATIHGHVQHTLGLGYLQSNVKAHNAKVEVVYDRVSLRSCDMIGLSASASGAKEAVSILENSKIPVILGGPLTAWDKIYNYDFKHIVLSEGENAFNEILEGTSERIIRRPHIEDLDTLNFPSRLISPTRSSTLELPPGVNTFRVEMAMITARGCPYSCSYCCTKNTWGNKVRFHSAEYILDDVKHAISQCPELNSIRIEDDLFTVDHKRLERLHDLWLKNDLHKKLVITYCSVMPHFFNEDVARMMREMGVVQTRVGAESLDPDVLKTLGKSHTEDDIQKIVDISSKYKMKILVYLMYNVPGQTDEHIQHSINFIRKNPRIKVEWMNFKPFPGSALYDGRDVLTNDWFIVSGGPPQLREYVEEYARQFRSVETKPSIRNLKLL